MATNAGATSKARYIRLRSHWLRDAVSDGELRIEFVPTSKMLADLFTKAHPMQAHRHLTRELGVEPMHAT